MIVWINGAFGAGKSQAAYELVRRAEGAFLSDPEEVGFGLHRMIPRSARGDFQDQPAWRIGVRDSLIAAQVASHLVVVPMTLVVPEYVDEIIGGLAEAGLDVRHVILDASPETLRRRLEKRAVPLLRGEDSWAVAQIERCTRALAQMEGLRVDTDALNHDEVVEAIARSTGVELVRPRHGRVGRTLRTMVTSVRVIRL